MISCGWPMRHGPLPMMRNVNSATHRKRMIQASQIKAQNSKRRFLDNDEVMSVAVMIPIFYTQVAWPISRRCR
jgi:hypothetical protein